MTHHPSKRRRLAQHLFAWFMHRAEGPMNRFYGARKETLIRPLRGTILEIGAGAGANMPFYQAGTHLIALEPNVYMHPYLRKEADRFGVRVDIIRGKAENLDLADASVDAVVSTLVLCSVREPAQALAEILRVLKPGGRFVFVEHVIAPPGSIQRRIQNAVRPIWSCAADGCQPNRDTTAIIQQAGFHHIQCDHFRVHRMLIVSTHIAGEAAKG